MTTRLIYPTLLLFLASACGERSAARGAAQQQYETVEEGSAAGLTSTIHGPGETLPPITDTNVDTTSAFAFNPNTIPPPPLQTSGSLDPIQPPAARPDPTTQLPREGENRPAEPVTDTSATTQPPTNTETSAQEEVPPPADDTSGEQAEEPPPPPPMR